MVQEAFGGNIRCVNAVSRLFKCSFRDVSAVSGVILVMSAVSRIV